MRTMYSTQENGETKQPLLTEELMEVDSGQNFANFTTFGTNFQCLNDTEFLLCKPEWQGPTDHTFKDLLQILEQDSSEEEATADATGGCSRKVDCSVVVLSADDGNECSFIEDQQKAETKEITPAVEEEVPVVHMTEEPQLLSQSNFPKPWEEAQSSSSSSSDASSTHGSSTCHELEPDLDAKVDYMKQALERYDRDIKANSSNGKIQVHQVVHFLLLASVSPTMIGVKLGGILDFCDANGKPTKSGRDHFKTMDTKTMGIVWQKVKGNRNSNYDTFARAMRVGRERDKEYFSYLDSGKGSRKKIYKLGEKSHHQLKDMKRKLSSICTTAEN